MSWTHPVDRPDASPELRVLANACVLIAGAAECTPVGAEIDAPEWAWVAIEWARKQFPGFSWDTMMCPEWQAEKSAAFAAARAADEAASADEDAAADEAVRRALESSTSAREAVVALVRQGVIGSTRDAVLRRHDSIHLALLGMLRDRKSPLVSLRGDRVAIKQGE